MKNTSLGLRKRDITRDPVRHPLDWKITFLNEFNCWVEKWIEFGRRGFALSQTNKALINLINHLFSQGFNYILLGQFQSDMLESRFGWYRQMSCANNYLSLNQLLASERKIRTMSLLKFNFCEEKDISELSSKSFSENRH